MRWASLAPTPLPLWDLQRLAQFVRPHDCSAAVACLTLCIAWSVTVGFAAYPVAWLLIDERLLGAALIATASTSFSCCSSIHLPWRASLPLVPWFTCPCSTTGLLVGSVRGTILTAQPHRWSILGVGFAACPVAWLLIVERLLGAALIAAAGTSFSCCSSIRLPWRASLPLMLWFACPCSTMGLLVNSVRGTVITARPHCWPILGVSTVVVRFGCFLGSPARPHYWPLVLHAYVFLGKQVFSFGPNSTIIVYV
ncbi:hypothetical protein V6N13_040282 [Hibiscus sabdariffa]